MFASDSDDDEDAPIAAVVEGRGDRPRSLADLATRVLAADDAEAEALADFVDEAERPRTGDVPEDLAFAEGSAGVLADGLDDTTMDAYAMALSSHQAESLSVRLDDELPDPSDVDPLLADGALSPEEPLPDGGGSSEYEE